MSRASEAEDDTLWGRDHEDRDLKAGGRRVLACPPGRRTAVRSARPNWLPSLAASCWSFACSSAPRIATASGSAGTRRSSRIWCAARRIAPIAARPISRSRKSGCRRSELADRFPVGLALLGEGHALDFNHDEGSGMETARDEIPT